MENKTQTFYPSTFDVLGTRVSAVNLESAFEVLRRMVGTRAKGYVCCAPVSTIVDAKRDPDYRAVINAAAMVTPDGVPVAWLGRHRAGPQVRRTYGPDLMTLACNLGRDNDFRHFFYGGQRCVCDKLETHLKEKFPGLIVAGKYSPPYMEKAFAAPADVVRAINEARPDILWVGLGSPKQDQWMALNRAALDVPVMVGVGAAFDFLAGVKPQAPQWIQMAGLEWLFRFGCEPRRLWRRYLIGNSLFLWWLFWDSLSRRKHSTSV